MLNLNEFKEKLFSRFEMFKNNRRREIFNYFIKDCDFNFENKTVQELFEMFNSNSIDLYSNDMKINVTKKTNSESGYDHLLYINIYETAQNDYVLKKSVLILSYSVDVNAYSLSKIMTLDINDDESVIYTSARINRYGSDRLVSRYFGVNTISFLEDRKNDIDLYMFLEDINSLDSNNYVSSPDVYASIESLLKEADEIKTELMNQVLLEKNAQILKKEG